MSTSEARPERPARIEDHALLGDGLTAALLAADGTLDWLCWPRFDSPACFAALLGNPDNGHWSLAPSEPVLARARRYAEDTLVLETDHRTRGGRIRVTDFMVPGDGPSSIVRRVAGLEGQVPIALDLDLRFDHGRMRPWIETRDDGFVATAGPHRAVLRASIPWRPTTGPGRIDLVVRAGDTVSFVLSHGPSSAPPPAAIDVETALAATVAHWRSMLEGFDKPTDWPAAVRRSILTLLALVHRPTGGVIAAPTTSLSEVPGGSENWDYRYCWLRDSAFTMCALLNAGLRGEAAGWRDWLLRALAAEPKKLRVLYRVDGAAGVDEHVIDWLEGHGGARPVRVGNAAVRQRQLDVYGEVVDAMAVAVRGGLAENAQSRFAERALVEEIESAWQLPGQGLWEGRGEPQHHVYSKVMAWVGIDRHLRGPGGADLSGAARARLQALRAHMHREICTQGYSERQGTFVQRYGSDDLDASLLLLPALGFLPATDPRMARTIDAIAQRLTVDGLVMRYATPPGQPPEGAFLACTLWLADCRLMQGRPAEARAGLERVLALANDVGLLPEEFDVRHGRFAGNFPQALTHLAVINTALGLCGPVLQRAGG